MFENIGQKFLNVIKPTVKENKNKLQYFIPWTIFVGKKEEGIVFLKSQALMRCYEFVMPDMDSVDIAFLNSVSWSVNEALKKLDDGWSVHFECQRILTGEYPGSEWSNPCGYLIDKRREETFVNYGEHFVNRYIMTLTKHIKDDIYAKANKLLYKSSNEKGQDYFNWAECEKEIELFRGSTNEILSYINPSVRIMPLNNDQCTSYLHSTVSTCPTQPKAPLSPQFFDAFITDCDYQGGNVMKLGDVFCPIIAIKAYPNSTFPNQFSALTNCNVELRWVTRFIGLDKQKAHEELEHYQKRYHGEQKSWKQALGEVAMDYESSRTDPQASSDEADVESAMVDAGKDIVSFGYYTMNVMVMDKNYDIAMQKASYVMGLINKSGFGSKIEKFNNLQAFQGMMPGNVNENIRRPIMSTGNVAQIIPLSSMWQGNKRNYFTEENFGCQNPLLVCGTHSGTPFFYNQNVRDVGHGFVFGPTGARKSTFLCLLETQFLKYKNANVIILDKDKSARAVTMAAGGLFLEPGNGDVAFQPLRNLESESDLRWAGEFIELLLTEQKIEVTATMRKQILICLRQIAQTKAPELRTISTFQQYITYANPETGENDIAIALEPYTINGQYGAVFDANKTNIKSSKWLMIEMGTLMKMSSAAVTPALMFIFKYIETVYAKADGSPKGEPTLLILDESWVFLDNPFFRKELKIGF